MRECQREREGWWWACERTVDFAVAIDVDISEREHSPDRAAAEAGELVREELDARREQREDEGYAKEDHEDGKDLHSGRRRRKVAIPDGRDRDDDVVYARHRVPVLAGGKSACKARDEDGRGDKANCSLGEQNAACDPCEEVADLATLCKFLSALRHAALRIAAPRIFQLIRFLCFTLGAHVAIAVNVQACDLFGGIHYLLDSPASHLLASIARLGHSCGPCLHRTPGDVSGRAGEVAVIFAQHHGGSRGVRAGSPNKPQPC